MTLPINQIVCGDCLSVMKDWPAESISCCISSPPYWVLRDYGTGTWEGGEPGCDHKMPRNTNRHSPTDKQHTNTGSAPDTWQECGKCGAKRIDKQLGLEKTFEEYIDKLCTIYDEVKRVLRPDGTCFVNLGDTYWGGKGQSGQGSPEYQEARQDVSINKPASHVGGQKLTRSQDMQHDTIQAKSLCLIPQRFAIEMVNRGWILRNTIIWHKPNPMPSSAKDRFTVDFEYVYFFVKNKKYWFEPQYEPHQSPEISKRTWGHKYDNYNQERQNRSTDAGIMNPLGRNKRTVWTIPTQPYSEAHFATFPEKLVEPMIKAGCPEFVCTKCGKAREKIYDVDRIQTRPIPKTIWQDNLGKCATDPGRHCSQHYFKGYTDCGCGKEFRPGIVLDPFRRQWNGLYGSSPIAA